MHLTTPPPTHSQSICRNERPFHRRIFSRYRWFYLAAALFLAGSCLIHAAPTPVEKHGALQVRGNRIVDQHGEPVVLRGMSLFWSQSQGKFYNADAIRWLRDDWRCTVVRAAMGVEHRGYLQNPEREIAKVRAVVDAAIRLGIYVIIDWHDHHADQHTAQAAEFFTEMARLYGDQPNVIYELWNEPLRHHDWSTVIKPYHETIVEKIRALDPDNLIVLGTQTWSQDVDKAALDPVKGKNLAYTLHFYAATHRADLRAKAEAALRQGAALMVTEWGTGAADGDGTLDEAETKLWWEFMERHQLSWCNWSIADKAETTAALRAGAAPGGGWPAAQLSPSGERVRAELRARNP